ncbi:MAG: hypothetical protein CAF45_000575 [Nitrospira sp. CG24E]|nr:MAG: hypothetical protein CAF45_000575 [Nitrospira sp. CG24E]
MIEFPDIPGLKLATRTERGIDLDVAPDTPASSFLHLLWWLPRRCELSFYDQFFPSPSDPGAYVDVQRKKDWFQYRMSNHGWSQTWNTQSPELIAAWLVLNLKAKSTVNEPLRRMRVDENVSLPDAFKTK